ncbi:MAG: T9SS type A sorting domain-containing protein [Ignavibacteriae bacterium]|nr:T9SS type A sorting domain-containing protein [Ignavibacteriota bacterium]MCB9259228.1 T9SS type A sorting domain-containing protein [Ignavibacteriales bacterium]
MRKILLILFLITGSSFLFAQTTMPIDASPMAVFTVPSEGNVADTLLPYYADLGVRRVIVADADGDGSQEILATDYSNGGRVHVMKVVQDSLLEIIWSSPVAESSSGSTPRFIQVGDCDGDGNFEIIFEQRNYENADASLGRIALYEWNGTDWGTTPAFTITPATLAGAGGREGLRLHREVLTVYDFDGDGRTEIIPHGDDPRQDVLILGVNFAFPGFASLSIEGGKPGVQTNGGDWGAGGSFYNSEVADIDGDGQIEIINHTWNNYGFWSIEVAGPNSYVYPEAVDNADAKAKGFYHEYSSVDAVSYFGARAVDVDGDGKDEIVGTQYGNSHNVAMLSFPETATGNDIWTNESQSENYAEIVPSSKIAALAGKEVVELWPIVKGDLNRDGKDEMYTGGGTGLNLVAIQYNGLGSLLDPNSYDLNLVYDGAGGEVFATYKIQRGRAEYEIDTLYAGTDSAQVIKTPISFDPTVVDTIREETPFTSYIFADSVDLDNDGRLEVVLAEQSVYDSISVDIYDWVDSLGLEFGRWELNNAESYKIFNDYRQTVRVLEYQDGTVGFRERLYDVISPDDYKLAQNYPNPFNPTTAINFSLPIDKKITLKVYNMVGQEVKTLINDVNLKKGNHEIIWDGTNNFGSKVASGNYIAKMEFGNFAKSIKMTLLK